jgi:flagellar motor switch protein FliN
MTDDALSKEEIDALLADTAENSAEEEPAEIPEYDKDNTSKDKKNASKEITNSSSESEPTSGQQQHNIQLLLDIYMQITVELGKTSKKVKDILGWGEGSIIELEKPSSEPVNILVNKRLVAKGEVVVIDENFGVRITEIVDPRERLMSIAK